nr:hypothetical protein [uncultured Psychroserpens sp.]
MKTHIFSLLFLLSTIFTSAQIGNIPTGSYYSEDEGMGFYFHVDDNNEFRLSLASGKITSDSISNLEIKKQKTLVFGVKFTKTNTSEDSLTIKFSKNFKSYYLDRIFFGTKNNLDETANFEKGSSLKNSVYPNDNEPSFKISREKYLLILEENYNTNSNILHEYEIPKSVSEIEITYRPSQRRENKLHAVYNAEKQIVTINEVGRNNPLTFYKDFDEYLEGFKNPTAVSKDVVWRNEEKVKPIESYYNSPYTFKLKTFDSYKNALQTAKNDNKLLLTFFLPNGDLNEQNYKTFAKNYEEKLSNIMYDSYKSKNDKFHMYLLQSEDKDIINNLALNENELIVLDGNEFIIYRRKATIADLSKEIIDQVTSYARNDFDDMFLMKQIDDAVQSKTFNAIKTQRIFSDLTNITAYDFFSGHESVQEKSYREEDYIKNNSSYYKLQSNLNQVNQLYDNLIDFHNNDTTVDFQFASIISKTLVSHFKGLLYKNFQPQPFESDLKSIDYLLKFKNEIENYKPTSDEDYSKGYDFYNLSYTITSFLNRIANHANDDFLKKIKLRYKALKTDNNEYLLFLKKFIPEDYLNEYKDYYNSNKLHNDKNIIVRLDEMYEENNSNKPWDIYKSSIANEANEAAWVVVEKITDKKLLKEALKWSKTSLDIKPDNAYYLDTYAQLLYKNGDKKLAIEHQTKAVEIISKNLKVYSTSLLNTTKNVLIKMKDGTY